MQHEMTFNKLSDDTTEQWGQKPFNEDPKELFITVPNCFLDHDIQSWDVVRFQLATTHYEFLNYNLFS